MKYLSIVFTFYLRCLLLYLQRCFVVSKTYLLIFFFLIVGFSLNAQLIAGKLLENTNTTFFPADKSIDVNPDTHLEITFRTKPTLGRIGLIRIYDAADNRLVDVLDLSIPPGPTTGDTTKGAIYTPVPYEYSSVRATNANTKPGTPSGLALPTADNYQLTIIGGFSDAFHFYPVIIRGNKAVIYLHNNMLDYNHSYYVQIDAEVFSLDGEPFDDLTDRNAWRFSTKKNAPPVNTSPLVVDAQGRGHFNTVQGALDFVPDYNTNHVTIYIRNGDYEEIVYFRNKANITILGESRDSVVVHYANNEVFNPHPKNIKTNELKGTFPSRRAAFMVDNSTDIQLLNLTIKTTAKGQAEGLLVNGERILVANVTIVGSGDALQTNGTAYYNNCLIIGDGDTVLGRGAAFFQNCELNSYGSFMWIRNTDANHGNVFVDCKFKTLDNTQTDLARSPTNHGKNYPYTEAVLFNCTLDGIVPEGWGEIGGETSNVKYWEYNSTNVSDGKPVDVSLRHPASRQLRLPADSALIANYSNPAFVLNGWSPALKPVILKQSSGASLKIGQSLTFFVETVAFPKPSFQWYKNNEKIVGANENVFSIGGVKPSDAGEYWLEIVNANGSTISDKVVLVVRNK